MTIAFIMALLASFAWVAFLGYQFYQLVESRGTWYNDLRRDDSRENTFRNRLRITLDKRLDVGTTIVLALGTTVIVFGLSYFVSLGVLTLAGGCL